MSFTNTTNIYTTLGDNTSIYHFPFPISNAQKEGRIFVYLRDDTVEESDWVLQVDNYTITSLTDGVTEGGYITFTEDTISPDVSIKIERLLELDQPYNFRGAPLNLDVLETAFDDARKIDIQLDSALKRAIILPDESCDSVEMPSFREGGWFIRYGNDPCSFALSKTFFVDEDPENVLDLSLPSPSLSGKLFATLDTETYTSQWTEWDVTLVKALRLPVSSDFPLTLPEPSTQPQSLLGINSSSDDWLFYDYNFFVKLPSDSLIDQYIEGFGSDGQVLTLVDSKMLWVSLPTPPDLTLFLRFTDSDLSPVITTSGTIGQVLAIASDTYSLEWIDQPEPPTPPDLTNYWSFPDSSISADIPLGQAGQFLRITAEGTTTEWIDVQQNFELYWRWGETGIASTIPAGEAKQLLAIAEDGGSLTWVFPDSPPSLDKYLRFLTDLINPDVPDGTDGQVLAIDATGAALEWITLPEAPDLSLYLHFEDDSIASTVPVDGTSGQVMALNASTDALEWRSMPSPIILPNAPHHFVLMNSASDELTTGIMTYDPALSLIAIETVTGVALTLWTNIDNVFPSLNFKSLNAEHTVGFQDIASYNLLFDLNTVTTSGVMVAHFTNTGAPTFTLSNYAIDSLPELSTFLKFEDNSIESLVPVGGNAGQVLALTVDANALEWIDVSGDVDLSRYWRFTDTNISPEVVDGSPTQAITINDAGDGLEWRDTVLLNGPLTPEDALRFIRINSDATHATITDRMWDENSCINMQGSEKTALRFFSTAPSAYPLLEFQHRDITSVKNIGFVYRDTDLTLLLDIDPTTDFIENMLITTIDDTTATVSNIESIHYWRYDDPASNLSSNIPSNGLPGQVLAVNTDGTALEWVNQSGGGSSRDLTVTDLDIIPDPSFTAVVVSNDYDPATSVAKVLRKKTLGLKDFTTPDIFTGLSTPLKGPIEFANCDFGVGGTQDYVAAILWLNGSFEGYQVTEAENALTSLVIKISFVNGISSVLVGYHQMFTIRGTFVNNAEGYIPIEIQNQDGVAVPIENFALYTPFGRFYKSSRDTIVSNDLIHTFNITLIRTGENFMQIFVEELFNIEHLDISTTTNNNYRLAA